MREGDLEDVMRGDLEALGLSSCLAVREPRHIWAGLRGMTCTKCARDGMVGTRGCTCPAEPDTCKSPSMAGVTPALVQSLTPWPSPSHWERAKLNLSPHPSWDISHHCLSQCWDSHAAGASQLDGHGGAEREIKLSGARSRKIMLAPSTLFPRFWQ